MMSEQIEAARQMVVDALMGSTAIRDVALTIRPANANKASHLVKRRTA